MKSILLIGLNKFGTLIARQLHDLGHQVLAVDRDEERINAVLPFVTEAQIGDSTNEELLRSIGVGNYDVCVVALGSHFQSLKLDLPATRSRQVVGTSTMRRPITWALTTSSIPNSNPPVDSIFTESRKDLR